jgi:broad specificity phosphatase PhoE
MSEASLTIIRHGESNWNAEGRQQGHLDSGLSHRGRKQAEAMANALRGRRFDAIYSSDPGRAQQTAEIIAEALGLRVLVDPRLRVRHLGIFHGHTWP